MPARTIVIAHRGASGYLPEHTREAKTLAFGQGADYLEQDVVATRDGHLVVLHDLYLELVTDVAERFPRRRRADGHFYVLDFDLDELRTLCVNERRAAEGGPALYPGRFPIDGTCFRIVTLDEEARLVEGLNRSTGRRVGLYPEIKHPRWHRQHGIDLTRLVLEKLRELGYASADDAVFVQCFDAEELRRARVELGTALRLVLLVNDPAVEPHIGTPGNLAKLTEYIQGVGPPYSTLVEGPPGAVPVPSRLCERMREAGLLLHPFTFRRESLPDYATSLEDLLGLFIGRLGVDGVFCDYPDVAVRLRDAL